MRTRRRPRSVALALLDDEALHGAAEITALVRQPRRGEARTVGADQGFAIEQNPLAHRLARQTDGEIGIDKGPFPEIQRGRSTVAEIREWTFINADLTV